MALGRREDYSSQQYEQAAAAFDRVDRSGLDGLEAGFYGGLSLLFSGNYPQAEKAFANVARVLPLAEVVNNQGVAVSRQGHDGTALFVQAASADPNDADYHFNLAVSLKRHGASTAALNELTQCLKLRPSDSEAQSLDQVWKARAAAQTMAGPDAATSVDPLERIVRTFDAAAFRQAALMLDQMDSERLAALTPGERALKLSAQAKSTSTAACCWRPSGSTSLPSPRTAMWLTLMPDSPRSASAPEMPARPAVRRARLWN